MKYRISLMLILIAACGRLASADPETEQIRKLAAENSAALTSGNYERLVELTYPKVVEMVGGRDKMIETLRRGAEDLKAQGSAILGAEVSEPKQVATVGNSQFAIVPMTVRIKVPEGTLRSKGYLIAVSENLGKTWTFIDGAGLRQAPAGEREALEEILPSFPARLSLPLWEPPVLKPR